MLYGKSRLIVIALNSRLSVFVSHNSPLAYWHVLIIQVGGDAQQAMQGLGAMPAHLQHLYASSGQQTGHAHTQVLLLSNPLSWLTLALCNSKSF